MGIESIATASPRGQGRIAAGPRNIGTKPSDGKGPAPNAVLSPPLLRRSGRAVEGGGFEIRCRGDSTGGSNPSSSASFWGQGVLCCVGVGWWAGAALPTPPRPPPPVILPPRVSLRSRLAAPLAPGFALRARAAATPAVLRAPDAAGGRAVPSPGNQDFLGPWEPAHSPIQQSGVREKNRAVGRSGRRGVPMLMRDDPAHWRDESRGGVRRPTPPTIRRHLQAAPSRGVPT